MPFFKLLSGQPVVIPPAVMIPIPAPFAVPVVPGLHELLAAGALGDYEAGHN